MKKLIILGFILILLVACHNEYLFTAKLMKAELRFGFGKSWQATFDDGHVIEAWPPSEGWIVGQTYRIEKQIIGYRVTLVEK